MTQFWQRLLLSLIEARLVWWVRDSYDCAYWISRFFEALTPPKTPAILYFATVVCVRVCVCVYFFVLGRTERRNCENPKVPKREGPYISRTKAMGDLNLIFQPNGGVTSHKHPRHTIKEKGSKSQ
jgi:hypothetical protein